MAMARRMPPFTTRLITAPLTSRSRKSAWASMPRSRPSSAMASSCCPISSTPIKRVTIARPAISSIQPPGMALPSCRSTRAIPAYRSTTATTIRPPVDRPMISMSPRAVSSTSAISRPIRTTPSPRRNRRISIFSSASIGAARSRVRYAGSMARRANCIWKVICSTPSPTARSGKTTPWMPCRHPCLPRPTPTSYRAVRACSTPMASRPTPFLRPST